MKIASKLWMGIAILILISPLGILLPYYFKAGGAWGEWGVSEMQKLVGYIPKGMGKLSSLWNAPMSDYAFKGCQEKGLFCASLAYIISAALGIVLIVLLIMILGRILVKKR